MHGYLILSEARSGSNWLASLANDTGVMGDCREWLQPSFLDRPIASHDADSHFGMILSRATGDNGRFGVKVFPSELYAVHGELGYDFVRRCRQEHEVSVVLLRRRDTLAQAISLTRALQTRQWHSTGPFGDRQPEYSFRKICESLFFIHRSNEFWSVYATTQAMDHRVFYYEDLLDNRSPWLDHLAGELGVTVIDSPQSDFGIQRDATNAAWRERFLQDAGQHDILAHAHLREIPSRTLHNGWQFLRKELTKPFPFALHFDRTRPGDEASSYGRSDG